MSETENEYEDEGEEGVNRDQQTAWDVLYLFRRKHLNESKYKIQVSSSDW